MIGTSWTMVWRVLLPAVLLVGVVTYAYDQMRIMVPPVIQKTDGPKPSLADRFKKIITIDLDKIQVLR